MDYTRKKHVITEVASGKAEAFKSINAAKRESRRLQLAGNNVSVVKEGAGHVRKTP